MNVLGFSLRGGQSDEAKPPISFLLLIFVTHSQTRSVSLTPLLHPAFLLFLSGYCRLWEALSAQVEGGNTLNVISVFIGQTVCVCVCVRIINEADIVNLHYVVASGIIGCVSVL